MNERLENQNKGWYQFSSVISTNNKTRELLPHGAVYCKVRILQSYREKSYNQALGNTSFYQEEAVPLMKNAKDDGVRSLTEAQTWSTSACSKQVVFDT